jgi:hypothetical protein
MNSHPQEKQQHRHGSKLRTKRRRYNKDEDESESRSLQNDNSRPLSSQSNNLESLQDEILKSVAKLCAARDFIILFRASKRLRKLLMNREIVSDVISIGEKIIRKIALPSGCPRVHRNPSSLALWNNWRFTKASRNRTCLRITGMLFKLTT